MTFYVIEYYQTIFGVFANREEAKMVVNSLPEKYNKKLVRIYRFDLNKPRFFGMPSTYYLHDIEVNVS